MLGQLSYPTETWTLLGYFQASPSRKMQEFKLKTKKLAKYIKIKLLSHHANEFYCTLSSVKVFGTTQWEEMSRSVVLLSRPCTPPCVVSAACFTSLCIPQCVHALSW